MNTSGNNHQQAMHFHHPPRRVVSLVPSLTESLFDLGLGEAVVGITDYCIQPAENLANLPRVGGTKNPRIEEILALKPELVLVNWEENAQSTVEALEAAGVTVWVTHPKSVRQAMDILWTLAGLFKSQASAVRLEALETALDWTKSAAKENEPLRYFCPIWYDQTQSDLSWWMTFNQHTYCHDLLELCGGANAFAERERRYPLAADLGMKAAIDAGDRDTRYPRLRLEEIIDANPEIILLPSEPYLFDEAHLQKLSELLKGSEAINHERIYLVDGSLITWHGTRLARALRELPALFAH